MSKIFKTWSKNDEYDEHRIKHRKQTLWYEFVSQNKMIEGKRDEKNPNFSHTLLSGGVLNCPVEKLKELMMNLSKDIQDGYVPDFNEIAPPISRLYFDLDFKDKVVEGGHVRLYSQKTIKELDTGTGDEKFPAITIEEEPLERRRYHNIMVASCIARKVYEYFPTVTSKRTGVRSEETRSEDTFRAHVMWRPSRFQFTTEKYVNKNGQHVEETKVTQRSFGMHLVFPNLYVTQEQALDIREGVVRALAQKFVLKNTPTDPEKISPNIRSQPGLNSWEEIVDEKIYLPVASMRMVYSDKYEPCAECVARNLRLYGSKKAPVKAKNKNSTSNLAPAISSALDDDNDDPFDDYRLQCVCHGSGKAPANSIYNYEATVDAGGYEWTDSYQKIFKRNPYQVLISCCITDPNRPDFVRNKVFRPTDHVMQLPPNAPRYPKFKPSARETIEANEQNAKDYQSKVSQIVANARHYQDNSLTLLSIDTKEFATIQNLFTHASAVEQDAVWILSGKKRRKQKKIEDVAKIAATMQTDHQNVLHFSRYEGLAVYRLRRGEINGNFYYLVDVCDTASTNNAKYCFNVNRHHTCEQNVYFKITAAEGITQKCVCWGYQNRPMPCKKFQSHNCPLPTETTEILFSEQLKNQYQKTVGDILIATGCYSASNLRKSTKLTIDEIKEMAAENLTKPFQCIAVDEDDVKLLNKYVNRKRKHVEPIPNDATLNSGSGSKTNEQKSASSHGPVDPIELLRMQKYDDLYESQQDENVRKQPIDIGAIEKMCTDDDDSNDNAENDAKINRAVLRVLQPDSNLSCSQCKKSKSNNACNCCPLDKESIPEMLKIGMYEIFPNDAYRPTDTATDCTVFYKSKEQSTQPEPTFTAEQEEIVADRPDEGSLD